VTDNTTNLFPVKKNKFISIFIWVNKPLSAVALGSHYSRLDANEIFLIFWSPPTQVGLIIFLPSRPPQMRKNRARRSKWKRGEYFTSCDDRLSSPAWAIHLSLGKKSLWLRRACGRHTGGEWEVERATIHFITPSQAPTALSARASRHLLSSTLKWIHSTFFQLENVTRKEKRIK